MAHFRLFGIIFLCALFQIFARQPDIVQTQWTNSTPNGRLSPIFVTQESFRNPQAGQKVPVSITLWTADSANISHNSTETITFWLEEFSPLAPSSALVVATTASDLPTEIPFEAPSVRYFRGEIPTSSSATPSLCFLVLENQKCTGFVEFRGKRYILSSESTSHTNNVFPENIFLTVDNYSSQFYPHNTHYCHSEEQPNYYEKASKLLNQQRFLSKSGQSTSTLLSAKTLVIRVALDCDYDYYLDHNQQLSRATQYALSVVAAASAIYKRDLNIEIEVSYLRIWTVNDPFTATSAQPLLNQFGTYWRTTMTSVQRATAILLSGINGIGGMAWQDGICSGVNSTSGFAVMGLDNNISYPTQSYAWDSDVFSHELGHNLGASHTHSCLWSPPIDSCVSAEGTCFLNPVVRRGTIMSYCNLTPAGTSLYFHPRVATLLRTRAEQSDCIAEKSNALTNDLSLTSFQMPLQGSILSVGQAFSPRVQIRNIGTQTQSGYSVLCKIISSTGATVYTNSQAVPTLSSSSTASVAFALTQLTMPDMYMIQCTLSPNDLNIQNNILARQFAVAQSTAASSIQLVSPIQSVRLRAGEMFPILWQSTGVSMVSLEFSPDNGWSWQTVQSSTSASGGSFQWKIPPQRTDNGLIKITSLDNSAVTAVSTEPFSIDVVNDISVVEILSPIPKENNFTITPLLPTIRVRNDGSMSVTNATVRFRIVSRITGKEQYNEPQEFPQLASGKDSVLVFPAWATSANGWYECSARVYLSGDENAANDSLSRAVNIVGTTAVLRPLLLVAPTGNEKIQVGTARTIRWSATSIVGDSIVCWYSTNNGTTWTELGRAETKRAYLTFRVPNVVSDSVRICVTSVSGLLRDTSALLSSIAVSPPGTIFGKSANNAVQLEWSASPSQDVSLYRIFRAENGSSSLEIGSVSGTARQFIDSTARNCQKYLYSIIAEANEIRSVPTRSIAGNPKGIDSVEVLFPNGAEQFVFGQNVPIRWAAKGCFTSVLIEYSTNNGISWETIVPRVSANSGQFLWTVPSVISSKMIVVVRDADNAETADASNEVFSLDAPPAMYNISLKVVLEGAFDSSQVSMRVGLAGIPQTQPYREAPFNLVSADTISSPSDIVDWLVVEFRSEQYTLRKAGILLSDGRIISANQPISATSNFMLLQSEIPAGAYEIAVLHRNHLSIRSSVPVVIGGNQTMSYNFSEAGFRALSLTQPAENEVMTGIHAMVAGDVNSDGKIDAADRALICNKYILRGFLFEDCTLDGVVNENDTYFARKNTMRVEQKR